MDIMNLYNEKILDYNNLDIKYDRMPSLKSINKHVRFYLYCYYHYEEATEFVKNKNFLELLEKN